MRALLTVHEARCHLSIIELVNAVLAHPKGSDGRRHADWNLYNESEFLMRDFRPRCQCGAVLKATPMVDGARVQYCDCGWRTWQVST